MNDKLRIAICEDDQTQLDYMETLVERWAGEKGQTSLVDCYISAEQLLYSFDADLPYKLYLLDIQMGEMSGMELARKIRERDQESVIIFLTGCKEYALEGYEVGAFRYLLKPVKEEELFSVLEEMLNQKVPKKKEYFILKQAGELLRIPYDEIWHVIAQGHYVEILHGTEPLMWKAGFGKIQREFEEKGFVLCSRGILVNIRKISKVGRTQCELDNGEQIPISRSRYKSVNEAFIQYFGGEEKE